MPAGEPCRERTAPGSALSKSRGREERKGSTPTARTRSTLLRRCSKSCSVSISRGETDREPAAGGWIRSHASESAALRHRSLQLSLSVLHARRARRLPTPLGDSQLRGVSDPGQNRGAVGYPGSP